MADIDDDFEFDLDTFRPRISDQEILDSLKTFSELHENKAFTINEYDKWPKRIASQGTIIKRFGSWRKALSTIDVTGGKVKIYSNIELMDNLEMIWRELGRRPATSEIAKYGRGISSGPYRSRWGSLYKACSQLSLYKKGKISEDELLKKKEIRPSRSITLSLRWQVLKRDNYRCVRCGALPDNDKGVALEVDHVVPYSRGGSSDLSNLQTLCNSCNQGKKDLIFRCNLCNEIKDGAAAHGQNEPCL